MDGEGSIADDWSLIELDGAWKIHRLRLSLFWQRGNQEVLGVARQRVASGAGPVARHRLNV